MLSLLWVLAATAQQPFNPLEALQSGAVSPTVFNEDIAFSRTADEVVIGVEIGSAKVTAMFDTGAPCIIPTSLMKQLNLKPIGYVSVTDVAGNSVQQPVVMLDRVKLGGATFSKIAAVVSDLDVPEIKAMGVQAVIGANLMRHAKFQVDYGKARLRFSNQIDSLKKPDDKPVAFQPSASGTPYIRMSVGKLTITSVMLDTGNSGGLDLPSMYLQAIAPDGNPKFPHIRRIGTDSQALFGTVGSGTVIGWFDKSALGDHQAPATIVTFVGQDDPIVGNRFFGEGVITFDWAANKVYLRDTDKMGLGVYSGYGWRPRISEGRIVVANLVVGSAAEKAGLKPNDVLLRVNDLDLAGDPVKTYMTLRHMLDSDQELTVTWMHEGEKKMATLKHEVYLPKP